MQASVGNCVSKYVGIFPEIFLVETVGEIEPIKVIAFCMEI